MACIVCKKEHFAFAEKDGEYYPICEDLECLAKLFDEEVVVVEDGEDIPF